MKRLVLSFLILLFLFIFSSLTVYADSNFSTDYNVTYSVSQNSLTHVTINATLTNLTEKYYATSYSVQIGFRDIENISGFDSEGSLNPRVIKKDSGSQINIAFNKQVIGIGNKLNFSIAFDTSEVAQNFNNVWDINIPGISKENNFSSFNVVVDYPSFLGKPTYIKPNISDFNSSIGKISFTKDDLGTSGISLAFGNYQIYNFSLNYNLENKNLFPIFTEIALPPNTNYQEIEIDSLNPKPVNVRIDSDGNWLAQYNLGSSKKIVVTAKGKIKVYLNPKNSSLDPKLKSLYLHRNQFWESDNEKIVSIAKNLKTPFEIYQYVVGKLNYDFSRVETDSPRLGALKALENPTSAVCLEFTDLFIALARANGIPAREIDGFAYTNNSSERPLSFVKDILHAWPEYYDFDKNAWIMVDPTWGNTTGGIDYFNTLDFDHIAFVVKGLNSNYPVPAGGYKLESDQNKKDVDIKIGSDFVNSTESLSTKALFPEEIIAGTQINGYIEIVNKSSTLSKKTEISVSSNKLKPNSQSLITNEIPPYGHQLIALSFERTNFLTNTNDTIKISFDNNLLYQKIVIKPFF
ncbi:MAG TPA: transglutaminase-like domain-containing protein, partial [Candidatus Sulfotelmatobacter sp.]|nr:transglutaminase-like domain-containing protein [Candidatus Sulfotelmatobacter sp.]